MRKHSSMTRLSRDSLDGEGVVFYGSTRRNVDSCVQTDDEDGEERCVCILGKDYLDGLPTQLPFVFNKTRDKLMQPL